ncbi:MAG: RNase P subunit p30 family protein [Candidatus Hermodarchaeota archaeon]
MPYFESRLPVDFDDLNDIQKKLKFCEKLGIKNVILEPKNNLVIIPNHMKKLLKEELKINIFYRVNLKVDQPEDFKKRIKNFNNFSDILSIESLNKEVQLISAKDSRVDIVSFSNLEMIKTLTPGVISLTIQNNSFIEFSLAPVMVRNKAIQSKNFRVLYRSIQLALKLKANLIISGNFDDLYDLRNPRALISICNSLLGIPLDVAKRIFSTNPKLLLERSNRKRNINFESEVKLIKGKDDNG